MIITQITGGLGNQMFQYAAGKSLAYHYNTSLKIDTSKYQQKGYTSYKYHTRIPKLHNFQINTPIATWLDRQMFLLGKPFGFQLLHENEFGYHESVFQQTTSNIYLKGFWQSEQYFLSIKEELASVFQLPHGLTGEYRHWKHLIEDSESIAVHVRRGDYVHHPAISKIHGACDPSYYHRAVQALVDRGVARYAEIFVFSNDIEWCQNELDFPFTTHFVDVNQPVDYQELMTMSCCRHFIIANSSFSWWAAWLANNPEKIIIAPKRWFKADHLNSKDLIPDDWLRI